MVSFLTSEVANSPPQQAAQRIGQHIGQVVSTARFGEEL